MISITVIAQIIVITILKLHRDDWFPGVVTEAARQLKEALRCIGECRAKHCFILNIAQHCSTLLNIAKHCFILSTTVSYIEV